MDLPPLLRAGLPIVGVIGGIGSGKSAVARGAAALANVAVIDADRLGHEVLEFDSVKSRLRDRYGSAIFDAQGQVNRKSLAMQVFGVGNATARRDLEAIVHPVIAERMDAAIAAAAASGRDAVLVDAAVLLEAGWSGRCDAIVYVDATPEVRWRRVQERSGWTVEELQRREASQLSLEAKRAQSTVVIENNQDTPQASRELLDFLCRRWGVCCNPLPNSSQHT